MPRAFPGLGFVCVSELTVQPAGILLQEGRQDFPAEVTRVQVTRRRKRPGWEKFVCHFWRENDESWRGRWVSGGGKCALASWSENRGHSFLPYTTTSCAFVEYSRALVLPLVIDTLIHWADSRNAWGNRRGERDCGTVQAHALPQQCTTSYPVLWLGAPGASPLQTAVPSRVCWEMWERKQVGESEWQREVSHWDCCVIKIWASLWKCSYARSTLFWK